MALLTLKDCRQLFWTKYTAWFQRIAPNLSTTVNSKASVPQPVADAFLNMGWSHIAEDLQLISILATGAIAKDEHLYTVAKSTGIFMVDRVMLQKDGKRVGLPLSGGSELTVDSSDVTSSGSIAGWSFGLVKHGVPGDNDTQCDLELRLYPAPNWDDADGIWMYGHAHPMVVDGDTSPAPYHMDDLNLAGVDFAMFLVTNDPRFLEVYQVMVKPWRKTGQGKEMTYIRYPNAVTCRRGITL